MADLTFEQAFQQLEEVVGQLEKGELTLEQSLALFEKGMRLVKLCE
ncbi:MAG: exodeoxyribonuclease VII small subunit, partial [Anaerolineae bacterium]